MSSDPHLANITTSEMEMIKNVLADAGYSVDILLEDKRLFDQAALLVIRMFLNGETSPYTLAARLNREIGHASDNKLLYGRIIPPRSNLN